MRVVGSSVYLNSVAIDHWKADNRGNFVAKFLSDEDGCKVVGIIERDGALFNEDGIDVDFDGSSPVCGHGINVPLTYTQAYASFGVRCIVGPTVPNNAGSLAAVQVTATKGSILNAPHPCAVAARHVIGQMLPDVVMGCLHQALGDEVPAEGTSCLWNPIVMGGHGLVPDADFGDATPFAVNLFHTGGAGARPTKDGLSATAFPSTISATISAANCFSGTIT